MSECFKVYFNTKKLVFFKIETELFILLVRQLFQRPVRKRTRGAVRASWKRGGVSSHPVASADAVNKQRPYVTAAERVREYFTG